MEESEAFLRREHASLTRAAYLLTGDVVAAQDLAQDAALLGVTPGTVKTLTSRGLASLHRSRR